MMLSDRDIKDYLAQGELEIDPLFNADLQIQPASVDLTLSNIFIIPAIGTNYVDGRESKMLERTVEVSDQDGFLLHPGDFVLGATRERVKLGPSIAARAEGRSSLGRLGILIHLTAGFIDAGYNGCITLEFANLSRSAVVLSPGMRICQLAVFQLSSTCERPYGVERGSKYVGGQLGPEVSRMQKDQK